MGRVRKLARDTAVLTAAGILMRCVGLIWQAQLARRIGAAGLGLWQLVLSVNSLAATLAISGIRFTATRLVSEELGEGNFPGAGAVVRACLCYALVSGCAAGALLLRLAQPVGFLWLGDARSVQSLRHLALTMPLISLASVLGGWFLASGRAWVSAAIQLAEQLLGIVCILALLRRVSGGDLAESCAAIARGSLMADAASLLLAFLAWLFDVRRVKAAPPRRLTPRLLGTALPLALSAYARVGLTTLEHLLVPKKLRLYGLSAEGALAGYGTVTGMVFPILFFPACLLTALAELTVPLLTGAQVRGDAASIRRICASLLRWTLVYALAAAALFCFCGEALGMAVYHTAGLGRWLRLLSPLVVLSYLDTVTDGCLKGLGQMLRSMCYNIAEALIGVGLTVWLLPRRGLEGWIFVLYFCEGFNFALSFSRLARVTGLLTRDRKKQKFNIFPLFKKV